MTTTLIKKILAAKYGYKNVSVKAGTGTARSWINIFIKVKNPCSKAIGQPCWDCERCEVTKRLLSDKSWKGSARQLLTMKTANEARELLKDIKFANYIADDGYNTENDCVSIHINFI